MLVRSCSTCSVSLAMFRVTLHLAYVAVVWRAHLELIVAASAS
jgi:hypothetical protein